MHYVVAMSRIFTNDTCFFYTSLGSTAHSTMNRSVYLLLSLQCVYVVPIPPDRQLEMSKGCDGIRSDVPTLALRTSMDK